MCRCTSSWRGHGEAVLGGDRGGTWEDTDTRLLECASRAASSILIKYLNPELACCLDKELLSPEFLWQDWQGV